MMAFIVVDENNLFIFSRQLKRDGWSLIFAVEIWISQADQSGIRARGRARERASERAATRSSPDSRRANPLPF